MQSALDHRLTPDARQRLCDRVLDRVLELRTARAGTEWETRREEAEKQLEGVFDFRKSSNPEEHQTIYDTENTSAQIVRSCWRFIFARLGKDFFGSEPWLSAQPEGPLDSAVASKIQKHSTWKLRQSNWKPNIKQGLGVALALGEAAIKTTYLIDEDVSERIAMVLCGPRTGASSPTNGLPLPSSAEEGEPENATLAPETIPPAGKNTKAAKLEPVVTQDGEYIYDTDESEAVIDEMTGNQTLVFPKGEEMIAMEPGMEFKEMLIEEKVRTYANVDAQVIYWKDLTYPENALSLEEAADRDVVGITYMATAAELMARYNPDGTNLDVEKLILEAAYPSTETSEADQPREANSEVGVPCPSIESVKENLSQIKIKITEAYTKRDVMGSGRQSRVFMIILEQCQKLLWIDYVANISPRAQWPISMAAINRVSGRVYGRGLFEIYKMAADIIDRSLSAIVLRNKQNSNPTKIFNGHLTKEGADGEGVDLEFNPQKTYSCKDANTKASDVLQYIEMPDLDERTWQLIELFMKLIQTESGVTNASQGDVSSLPSNSTATGVNSMLESSSVLHFAMLEEFREALEPALQYAIELIYFRQDKDETFEYMEGDAAEIMALAEAMQVRKLPINVRLLFQRAKRMEMRQAAIDTIPKVQEFYMMLSTDPEAAKRMRPLYVELLKTFEVPNIDEILMTADEIDQLIASQQAQQQQMLEQGAGAEQQQPPPDNVRPMVAA